MKQNRLSWATLLIKTLLGSVLVLLLYSTMGVAAEFWNAKEPESPISLFTKKETVSSENPSKEKDKLPSAKTKQIKKSTNNLKPEAEETPSNDKQLQKTFLGKLQPPESMIYPILQYEIPVAERIAMGNGMVLFLLEDHELPLVNISVVIRAGSAYDPPAQAGLADLTCRAMRTAGTSTLTGDELDNRLDRYAITISAGTEMETVRFGMSALRENLDQGVDLLSQILNTPRFDPQKVQTEKELTIEGLRRIEDDPQEYAFREFRKQIYRQNPRGNQSSIASVQSIAPTDLAAFHQKFFYPANMMIAITGDINREEAVKFVNRYFPTSPSAKWTPSLPPPLLQGDGHVIQLAKATPQSIVLLGFAAPTKASQDYYAFSVLDFVLGSGGFRSRIFEEIRNDRGLAYSTGSFYKARPDYGVFSAYAMTKSESTLEVLEAIKGIIRKSESSPLTAEEIKWAKKSITNSFLFSFVSADQIAYQQMMLEYDNLPEDFLKHYRERILKARPAEIQEAAHRYLNLDKATVLILGDEKKFARPTATEKTAGSDH